MWVLPKLWLDSLITDCRCFEGSIRTFPLAGSGIWAPSKLWRFLYIPQPKASSRNWKICQPECQLFGLLVAFFVFSPAPTFCTSGHLLLPSGLASACGDCCSALGEGMKHLREICSVLCSDSCLTLGEVPVGLREDVSQLPCPAQPLACSCCAWWWTIGKSWLVVQTHSVAEVPWDSHPCGSPHVATKLV